MEQRLSVVEVLKEAYALIFDNFKTFVLALLAWAGLSLLCYAAYAGVLFGLVKIVVRSLPLSSLKEMAKNKSDSVEPLFLILGVLFAIGFFVITNGLSFGFRHFVMQLCDKKKVRFSLLLSGFRVVIAAMVAGVLYLLTIMVGLIFLIVPGIYLAVRFLLFPYAILDTRLGPLDALRKSYRITEGNFWSIFSVMLIITGLALVVRLLTGKIVSVLIFSTIFWPFTVVVYVVVYRKLCALKELA